MVGIVVVGRIFRELSHVVFFYGLWDYVIHVIIVYAHVWLEKAVVRKVTILQLAHLGWCLLQTITIEAILEIVIGFEVGLKLGQIAFTLVQVLLRRCIFEEVS